MLGYADVNDNDYTAYLSTAGIARNIDKLGMFFAFKDNTAIMLLAGRIPSS